MLISVLRLTSSPAKGNKRKIGIGSRISRNKKVLIPKAPIIRKRRSTKKEIRRGSLHSALQRQVDWMGEMLQWVVVDYTSY